MSVENWLVFAGRLHPALVHFPIALVLVAACMEVFRFKRGESSKGAHACLGFGALGAIFAAFSGWRFAIEGHGESMPDELWQHRWGAIAVAVIASLTWLIGCSVRKNAAGSLAGWYRIGLVLAAGLVGYVGYLGGLMMYKPGYLSGAFEPGAAGSHDEEGHGEEPVELPEGDASEKAAASTEAEPGAEAPIATLVEPVLEPEVEPEPKLTQVDYQTEIKGIFESNCYKCHGPTGRAKAGMRLSSRAELFEGDAEFWIIQPGQAAESLLVEMISLPADHEDVMPPGKAGQPSKVLSAEQIALISKWIDQGAKFGDE